MTGQQLSTSHRGNNSFYMILASPVPHTMDVLLSQEASFDLSFFFKKKKKKHILLVLLKLYLLYQIIIVHRQQSSLEVYIWKRLETKTWKSELEKQFRFKRSSFVCCLKSMVPCQVLALYSQPKSQRINFHDYTLRNHLI